MARSNKWREPFETDISDLNSHGKGVSRGEGKVVFVAGALPGETVTAQRMQRSKKFDQAKLLDVRKASKHRVKPKCEVFDQCGGCALQHLAPEQQILHKQKQLLDDFERIGKVEASEILPPLLADAWQYRRRARLGVRYVPKKGRVLIGFRERFSNYITNMTTCPILDERIDSLLPEMSDLIGSLSISRHVPQIEVSAGDNAVALVFRIMQDLTVEDELAFKVFDNKYDHIHVYLQRGGLDTVKGLQDYPPLVYALGDDMEMEFQPIDFVQVNAKLNKLMIKQALRELQLSSEQSVLDLFCGLGNFTLPIAKQVKEVIGIEGDQSLVDRALINMQKHAVDNVSYYTANLFEDFKKADWVREFDTVFIDPPRAGAELVCQNIEIFNAQRIVYISCHPGSLARDSGILVNEKGYVLEKAGVMDMFPHTAHVESIAVFTKST